jgi:hypothetical protein
VPLAALFLELPTFGILALLLLVAIPAAVVTAMKGRWIWFAAGLFTFGVVWVIAAVALADPGSWWARTFYSEGQMRRAADPDRHRRSARLVALWLGGTLAAVLALGFLTARPSAVFGVSGEALQNSVDGFATSPCEHRAGRVWSCHVSDGSSSSVTYRVHVNRLGCWTATRVVSQGVGGRE